MRCRYREAAAVELRHHAAALDELARRERVRKNRVQRNLLGVGRFCLPYRRIVKGKCRARTGFGVEDCPGADHAIAAPRNDEAALFVDLRAAELADDVIAPRLTRCLRRVLKKVALRRSPDQDQCCEQAQESHYMDLRALDGYLLDGKPSKQEAIEHILSDRIDDPRAAPFYRAFEAIGTRAADEALIAIRALAAGKAPEDALIRRLRDLVKLARSGREDARASYLRELA